jgi:hypothetical protein
VIPHILNGRNKSEEPYLNIILFGCSNGAEPYSLASVLLSRKPGLDFHIQAYDCVPELVEIAKAATYPKDDISNSPFITPEFIDQTFEIQGDYYHVKGAVSKKVTFEVRDILDEPNDQGSEKADLVFAQNFLFHLSRPKSRIAFQKLTQLLGPQSGLFINGMDFDMRINLTKQHTLIPVEYLIKEVHDDAFVNAGKLWFTRYFGRLPFSNSGKDWVRKYSTVYLKGDVSNITSEEGCFEISSNVVSFPKDQIEQSIHDKFEKIVALYPSTL